MKHSGRCRLSHHRRRRGATYGRASAGGLASYRYRHRNAGTAIHRGCRQPWAAALQLREVVAERHIPQAGNKRVAPPRRPERQKPSRECRLRYLRPHAPWQPWRPSLQAPQRQPAGSVSWYSPVVKSMFPFWRKFRLQLQKALPKRLQNATMSILCQGMFTFHYSIHPACGSGTLDKAVCPLPALLCMWNYLLPHRKRPSPCSFQTRVPESQFPNGSGSWTRSIGYPATISRVRGLACRS